MHAFENIQGDVRVDAAFHVHLDGSAEGGGAGGDFAGHRAAELFVDVETELGEFDGDVAGEIFGVQLFDHLNVAGADFAGRGFAGDVFAEMVQADVAALGAEFLAGCERFREGFAGDETAREAVFHAVASDAIGDAAFCGQPEDEIANQHEPSLGEAARG